MIAGQIELGGGAGLALAGWLLPRRVAGARSRRVAALLLDALPAALGWSLLLVATGRPLFAGFAVLGLGAGLALIDSVKRDSLREPVVFSDMSELPHVFTHPHLYLPFAGTGLVVGGALTIAALALALILFEPALWRSDPRLIVAAFGLVAAAGWALAREPALGRAAVALRRLQPSGEPLEDAAGLGPYAMLYVYGIIARAERRTRQARVAAPAVHQHDPDFAAPLVLVQCESFFDARRMSPKIPADLLSGFDTCREDRATSGRLDVGGWGANTMRAEFAVLTGIADPDLGYDRFNPYHAFARTPITSLAWRLRAAGYRTICLHPFDRGFFRRDLAMPKLGFERFLGMETLGGSRRPPYCSDPELAHHILCQLDAEGPRCFLFAITMGNHGPWLSDAPLRDPDLPRLLAGEEVPQRRDLLAYLDGLRQSDEMIAILHDGLRRRGFDGVLGVYGDHLPSLPRAFAHFGFDERGSDYLVWRRGAARSRRLDLPAHRLPDLLLETLSARAPVAAAQD